MNRVKALVARFQASRPWLAWQRFGRTRGTVLAGGITYAAFFSLFPALAVGFSVFGLVLGQDTGLQTRVVDSVNDTLGTPIIKIQDADEGIVLLSTLTDSSALSITGAIALAGLLFTGLGWLDAMREGIRAMFGQGPAEGNVVTTKVRDIAVLVGMGLVVLASAVSGIVVNSATAWLLGLVGLEGSTAGEVVLAMLATLVLLAVDFTVLVVLFRFLAGVHLQREDLRDGALFGAVGLGLIKIFAGVLLGRVTDNQFLAAFAVALGLLVWLNLVARITLLAASWAAQTALDRGHLIDGPQDAPSARVTQLAVAATTAAAPPGPRPMYTPVVSPRQADRISVVSGAIIGAASLVGARVAAGALRTAVDVVRRRGDDD